MEGDSACTRFEGRKKILGLKEKAENRSELRTNFSERVLETIISLMVIFHREK